MYAAQSNRDNNCYRADFFGSFWLTIKGIVPLYIYTADYIRANGARQNGRSGRTPKMIDGLLL